MVPVDVKDGTVEEGSQKGEVIGIEIAAGDDHIDARQPFRFEEVPESGRFCV